LVNTGWSGGPYGIGRRIKLEYTRAMISAVLEEKLGATEFHEHPVFRMMIPADCPGVPSEILDPGNTWADKIMYDLKAKELARLFINNFEKYAGDVSVELLAAAPLL
jgi:phosphoenolpyruvate carboxykinase (ATP)